MRSSYFLHNNFIDLETVADSDVSSEESTLYPYSNAVDRYRRYKKWRTKGYWKVTGDNGTITFREAVGVDLVATVAPGEYATTALFCAAIKTALEVVGASTYTVAVYASKKIGIESNLGGGTGSFILVTTDPDSEEFFNLIGFSTSADLSGASTYLADHIRIHSTEWAQWDLGSAANPKAFVLSSAGNNYLNISPTATLTLQANDSSNFDDPAFELVLNYNQRHIVALSDSGLAPTPYRYWRIVIDDKDNADGFIEVNSLYLGDAYSPARGAVQFPLSLGYEDRSERVTTEGGVTFGIRKETLGKFTTKWDALTYDEKDFIDMIFEKFGTTRPFFVALDGQGAFSENANKYVRFCIFDKEPESELTSPNFFAVNIYLKETI